MDTTGRLAVPPDRHSGASPFSRSMAASPELGTSEAPELAYRGRTLATFAEMSSHLIDQLRSARDTAKRMATVTSDGTDRAFAEDVAARLDHLLDDLGCYD